MNKFENPNDFYEQSDDRKGITISLVLHLLLLLGIMASALIQPEAASGPVQLELWTEGQEKIVAPPGQTLTPNPAEEETRTEEEEPEPPPEPEPQKAPPPPPQPPPPQEAQVAVPQEDPEIALEKKREQDRLAKEKALAEQKAKEKKAKEEQAARDKALAEQKAKEQKAKEEQAAKELAEQKAKEAKEKAEKDKALAEAKKKKAREAKAAADARLAEQNRAKALAAGDARRAAMLGDINSIAGIKGGQNDRNQIGGGGGTSEYARKVQACVQPRLRFNGNQRLKLTYKVEFDNSFKVKTASIPVTSGNKAFDMAVINALKQCNPFPRPPGGIKEVTGPYTYRPN